MTMNIFGNFIINIGLKVNIKLIKIYGITKQKLLTHKERNFIKKIYNR